MEHNVMPIPLAANQEVTQQLAILSQQMLVLSGQLTKSTPHMPGRNIFLLEWLDSWLVKKKQLVGPKTWADYECLYRNHVQPAFQNVLLADITAQQLEDFYSKLLAVLAPSTVNKIKASILGNALRKAYAQRLIAYDPTVGIDPVRGEDRHHEAYTGEEIRKLAAASRESYIWIAFPLLICSGLRRAEMLALRWDDFNPERRTLHVTRDYISLGSGSQFVDTKTKSSRRLVVIPQSLSTLLESYHATSGQGKTYIVSQRQQDKPVEPHNFSRSFRRWCAKAGIPEDKWGGHCTRATFCTLASELGCSLEGIRLQAGHADYRTLLKVYIHERTEEKQYNVAEAVDKVFASLFFPPGEDSKDSN